MPSYFMWGKQELGYSLRSICAKVEDLLTIKQSEMVQLSRKKAPITTIDGLVFPPCLTLNVC